MTYVTEVLADNPAAYWRLNETSGTTLNDTTGNGHDGVYSGGFTLSQAGALQGEPSSSVLFDGTTGYATAGVLGVNITTGNWTIEAWVYPTAFGVGQRGIVGTNGTQGYCLTVANGAMIITCVNVADSTAATTPPSLNAWNYVAATFVDSSDLLSFYLNGQPDGSTTFTTTPAADGRTGTVGSRNTADSFWQGRIDEVAVYQTALSAGRIEAHFNAGGNPPTPPPQTALRIVRSGQTV